MAGGSGNFGCAVAGFLTPSALIALGYVAPKILMYLMIGVILLVVSFFCGALAHGIGSDDGGI